MPRVVLTFPGVAETFTCEGTDEEVAAKKDRFMREHKLEQYAPKPDVAPSRGRTQPSPLGE